MRPRPGITFVAALLGTVARGTLVAGTQRSTVDLTTAGGEASLAVRAGSRLVVDSAVVVKAGKRTIVVGWNAPTAP